jgi:glyoxylase-like metal-dependent hydrolase (beta-lactamase superfamily II)
MKIAPGIHRIGSDTVNSYLVVDGTDITIVDAGLPGYRKLLLEELARMGRSLGDVKALVLTHGDTDHIGMAAWLHAETGVPAHVHGADVDRARKEVSKPNSGWGPVKVGPLAGFLWYSARHGGFRIPAVPKVAAVADGDVLDVPGSPRIIHLPGHTPGSVGVHVPAVDAVFLGDCMTTRNRPGARTVHAQAGAGPLVLEPARRRRGDVGAPGARTGMGGRPPRGPAPDPSGLIGAQTSLRRMTSAYQAAESFGVLVCVSKSTWTMPNLLS